MLFKAQVKMLALLILAMAKQSSSKLKAITTPLSLNPIKGQLRV